MKMSFIKILSIALWAGVANATADAKDLLLKLSNTAALSQFARQAQTGGAKIESLGADWIRVQFTDQQLPWILREVRENPNVLAAQPNYPLSLMDDYRTKDPTLRAKLTQISRNRQASPRLDNPPIPTQVSQRTGPDLFLNRQWGMLDLGIVNAWRTATGKGIVVAVIDSGIDYQHPDLINSLWRNPGETGRDANGNDKATNGIDDDKNGFIDDVIGWDFASNDNRPYDLTVDPIELLRNGGNPGHGTHCAGNVAAQADNSIGIAGVAPEAQIMTLRFLTEKGQGTTANAIKSIVYAVRMGAKVLSNSWGSAGEDPTAPINQALKDAIKYAMNHGVLFVAAAGNGQSGYGYDNDTHPKPAYPASYDFPNIISVTAIDRGNQLGTFANWGAKSVDLGAPGVSVFSTTVGGHYSDRIVDIPGGPLMPWDGTSMAAPHVAGAAALWWSKNPHADWKQVKAALLNSVIPIGALNGRSVSGGKLNVERLVNQN